MSKIVQFQICRTAFCEECYKRGDPHRNQWYTVFGSHYQAYYFGFVRSEIRRKKTGFTPHLFIKLKQFDGSIVYERICMMNGCGIQMYFKKERLTDMTPEKIESSGLTGEPLFYADMTFKIITVKKETMTPSDWSALVMRFKHGTGYELDDTF